LGISRSGGARNPHVFQYTLRFLRSGGTRPSFARDGFFTNSQRPSLVATGQANFPCLCLIVSDWSHAGYTGSRKHKAFGRSVTRNHREQAVRTASVPNAS
ncbi:MAG: hypothetical protein ACREYE_17970, partial [Gammaproteobacteria bacterium]